MSGSVSTSSIFCTDTDDEIKEKINKYAFSGGRATAEEQRAKGAILDVDVAYQYLSFLMEDETAFQEISKNERTTTLSSHKGLRLEQFQRP